MKKIKFYILLLLAFTFGCDSFVDVDLPGSQLTGATVFEDYTTANAAMTDIYSKLRDGGFLNGSSLGSPTAFGLYTDELRNYGGTATPNQMLYSNGLLPSTSVTGQLWNESYHQIYCANAVIEGVAASVRLSETEKGQFTGQALFVRALVHFYLVNTYGDIPYVTATDYQQNRLVPRLPETQVYEHIASDLQAAISLLPDEYATDERTTPNKAVAKALLARTSLYRGLWNQASDAATDVISNAAYSWETNIDAIFLKTSSATIWQLKPLQEGDNTYEAQSFIFLEGPPPTLDCNPAFLNSFEPGDLRKSHWIGTVTNGADNWYYPNKYKENTNTGSSVEYSIIFRLAEQYLIRAEARARLGDLSGARADLNKVRNTAGLPDTGATTPEDIINAILQERRHELFTEYGHRFFDLRRTSWLDQELSSVKPGWNTTDRNWPLPETELLANPNLAPQNPGY